MGKKRGWLHNLKCWPAPFSALWDSSKSFEIRKADRDFQVGDYVALREWEPNGNGYTGRVFEAHIRYIARPGEWGLPDDLCVIGFSIGTGWENFDFDKWAPSHYDIKEPSQVKV